MIRQYSTEYRWLIILISTTPLWLLMGCRGRDSNPNSNVLQGTVRFADGNPVPGGTLHLTYDHNQDYPIPLGVDGNFYVPLGKAKVWIENAYLSSSGQYELPPDVPPALRQQWQQSQPEIDTSKLPRRVPLPPIYTKPDTTPWSWEITPGSNQKDFVIEKEKAPK